MKEIKVLVVDDSLIFRHAVSASFERVPDIKVVGSVRSGIKALEFIQQTDVDIVTLDIEMPEMNGLETLRRIQLINEERPQVTPIGVLMLSAQTIAGASATITALEQGAFDFVRKPDGNSLEENYRTLKMELITKIRNYKSGDRQIKNMPSINKPSLQMSKVKRSRHHIKAIIIGVSTGGPRALMDMIPNLCELTDLPILIVQHMPPKFTESLAESLDRRCIYRVTEARDGEEILPRHVYIAPGGKHMEVRDNNSGGKEVRITDAPHENGCRPSVDVLFRSAVTEWKGDLISVILTGMGNDGSHTIHALKNAGAYIIAQDEQTSVVWGMPGSAVETGKVDEILPLMQIPNAINKVLNEKVMA